MYLWRGLWGYEEGQEGGRRKRKGEREEGRRREVGIIHRLH